MARSPRAARWVLVGNDDGTFDLIRNGRQILVGASEQQVHRTLRQQRGRKDRMFQQAEDGYLLPM